MPPTGSSGPSWQRPRSGSRSRWARGTVGGVIALVFAGIMAATPISGFCPLYLLLGRSAGAGSWPEPGRDGRARVGPATAWGCCLVSLGACDVAPRSG